LRVNVSLTIAFVAVLGSILRAGVGVLVHALHAMRADQSAFAFGLTLIHGLLAALLEF
jgi:hypothetical protein